MDPLRLFALLLFAFAAGYGVRSYISHRRRERARRHALTDAPPPTAQTETKPWHSASDWVGEAKEIRANRSRP